MSPKKRFGFVLSSLLLHAGRMNAVIHLKPDATNNQIVFQNSFLFPLEEKSFWCTWPVVVIIWAS